MRGDASDDQRGDQGQVEGQDDDQALGAGHRRILGSRPGEDERDVSRPARIPAARSDSRRCGNELLKMSADAPADLVANGPHLLEALSGGIGRSQSR